LPAASQAGPFASVPVNPLPDASAAVPPDPSSNRQCAAGGTVGTVVGVLVGVLVPVAVAVAVDVDVAVAVDVEVGVGAPTTVIVPTMLGWMAQR
jgi:hypothetical protein